MNKYGELVERLIALKDMHRGDFDLSERAAIDAACNALEQEGTHGD